MLLKKYLFIAAEVARQWDPELAAFYHRLKARGHHHYGAVCAVANKMAGRVYALLNRMQRAEGSRYLSSRGATPPQQLLKPEEVGYKIRDLNGKIISKRETRRVVLENFYGNLSRKRSTLNTRSEGKLREAKNKSEESSASLRLLSSQPRQFPKCFQDNSSKRSGRALPAGVILKNTLTEFFMQHQFDDTAELSENLLGDAENRSSASVNNLWKGGGKKF